VIRGLQDELGQEPMQSKQPQFLDVKEVAALLRLKPHTVYDMVSNGRIPYRKARDRTIFFSMRFLTGQSPAENLSDERWRSMSMGY
jgi:excisionase family DNA binding protein